jgi:murein DD-endopeptidase MepM/ murein hydrolase activator NlpD
MGALLAVLLLLAGTPGPVPAATVRTPDGDVVVELHARALAPGEPVRLRLRAEDASVDPALRFLGRPVTLAREAEGPRWSGWAAVPLDAAAARAEVAIDWTAGGTSRHHAGTVRLEARRFPEQRLQVESRYVAPPADVTRRIEEERERLLALWQGREPSPVALRPFRRPVPGSPTGIFGERRFFNGEPRAPHPGLDLRATVGTPVLASGAGKVALAGDLYYTGGTVILDHGEGLFTVYAHLSAVEVEEGVRIDAGARVGLSGATGRVTGPHLHWGAKIGDVPVDPRALLDPRLFPQKK